MSNNEVIRSINERMTRHHLPQPKRPKGDEEEFTFPTDPERLSSVELGQRMLQLSAWQVYSLRLLGMVEAELNLLEHDVIVSGLGKRNELGRVNAETVRAAVLDDDDELRKRWQELETAQLQLETRAKIYERAWTSLSRELSRRELESRT